MSDKVDSDVIEPAPINRDLIVPNWLNAAFLQKHFRNYFNNKELKVNSMRVEPATAKGENYASHLYRVNVTFGSNTKITAPGSNSPVSKLRFIIKTAIPGEFGSESVNITRKEIELYSKVGPKLNEALHKLNGVDQVIAELYGVCEKNHAISFEDFKMDHYGLVSLFVGFDYDQAKIILKKLAAFHAINAVLQEQQPDIFKNFSTGVINRHSDVFEKMFLSHYDMTMEIISEWSDGARYIDKMRSFRSKLLEEGANIFDPDPNHFNTLIHGDFWVNNIMLKRPNGTDIENVVFVDFQYAVWTSPAVDLHYFFNNSLQEHLRPDRFDEFVAFYHAHLITHLKCLEFKKPIPTLEQFKKQYAEKSLQAFVSSCLIQPILLNEDKSEADIEALTTGDERSMNFKRLMYSTDKVRANIRKLIPIYDKLGLFD